MSFTRDPAIKNETHDELIDLNPETIDVSAAEAIQETTALHPRDEDVDRYLGFFEVAWDITKTGLPIAFSYTTSISILITLLFINLDENEANRAAAVLIAAVKNFIAVGYSPLFAMSLVISKYLGELKAAQMKDESDEVLKKIKLQIEQVNKAGWIIGASVTPFIITALVFSESILHHVFRQDREVAAAAQEFLQIEALALILFPARMCSDQILVSTKHTIAAMVIGLISLSIGTGVAWWLGRSNAGIPALGLRGIAAGFALETWLTAIGCSLYIALHPDFKDYRFFNFCNLKGVVEQLKNILGIGWSMVVGLFVEMSMDLYLGIIAGLVGVREQSVVSLIMQVDAPVFLFSLAFTQVCAQQVAYYSGLKHYRKASSFGEKGLLVSLLFMLPLPILFSAKSDWLLSAALKDHHEIRYLLSMLIVVFSVAYILDTVRFNALQQLRAKGDVTWPTLTSNSILVLGMALTGALALFTDLGIYGEAAGLAITITTALIVLLGRYATQMTPEEIKKPVAKFTLSGCYGTLFRPQNKRLTEMENLVINDEVGIEAPNFT